jgi:sensor histidine kinase YesM
LETNVDEDILDCFILKHLLQPLVENAVLHGLNGKG